MISKVSEIQVKQKYKEKHSTWECVHDCLRGKKNITGSIHESTFFIHL